jgi:magnesium chelatase family protein
MSQRPFRSPHHTASSVSLVGGGSYPQPGEISLAHNGVLFLDELPEFKREVLEVMRQPLEDREVTISRAKFTITYPSSFMLVASMNPSPGGYFNDPDAPVSTSPAGNATVFSKISGPLLDRIDIHIEVNPVPFEKLTETRKAESSAEIRKRVTQARQIQSQRFEAFENLHYNAQMGSKYIREFCVLDDTSLQLLKTAMERLNLSARAYDRILKVARTIADLEASENIKPNHIAEAIQYRSLDREGWFFKFIKLTFEFSINITNTNIFPINNVIHFNCWRTNTSRISEHICIVSIFFRKNYIIRNFAFHFIF